jgi:hypothetical protein
MFDLGTAISEWRQQMAAGGIKTPAVLDELESHLREDIERQMQSGITGQAAFESAVKKIGPAGVLKSEFSKSNSTAAALEKLMLAVAALFVAFGIFLTSVTMIFCYGSFGERFAGFSALTALLVAVFGLPHATSFLPVIPNRRKRLFIEIVCLLLGFGATTFYVQVILPIFDFRGDGILPAIGFWGLLPIAIGLGLAAGFERAARGPTAQIGT